MSVTPDTKVEPPKAKVYDGMQGSCDMLAAPLRSVVFRCASANGIAQMARSESRINALRRRCALLEGLICLFILGIAFQFFACGLDLTLQARIFKKSGRTGQARR